MYQGMTGFQKRDSNSAQTKPWDLRHPYKFTTLLFAFPVLKKLFNDNQVLENAAWIQPYYVKVT